MQNALIIFVRNPELGKVKTRLAKTLGDSMALAIYLFLLQKTRSVALESPFRRLLFYSENPDRQDDWPNEHFEKHVQQSGDLGQRMLHAFEFAFNTGADKVLIVGSDCPDLSPTILDQAFDALDTHEFVIGPVPDGGYYLLGMRQIMPSLFENIAWSTDTVRATTLQKITRAGARCFLLPMLTDIDTESDWNEWHKRNNPQL